MTILVLDVILRMQQVDSTYVELLVGLLECFGSVVGLLKAVFNVVYIL